MPRAAVIGGLMGHGIAQVLALGELEVVVYDPVPEVLEAVPARIAANLASLGITPDVRVELGAELEAAVADADWVFVRERVLERLAGANHTNEVTR